MIFAKLKISFHQVHAAGDCDGGDIGFGGGCGGGDCSEGGIGGGGGAFVVGAVKS